MIADRDSSISCEEFRVALEAAVDHRAALDGRAVQHGRTCPHAGCRSELADYELLERAIRSWKGQTGRPRLADRVVQDVVTCQFPDSGPDDESSILRPVPVRQASSMPRRAAALTAAVICAAVGVVLWQGRGGTSTQEQLAESRSQDSGQQLDPVAVNPVVNVTHDEVGGLPADWLGVASDRITSTVAFILPEEVKPEGDEDAPEARPAWSERFKPLEETLDATWRELFVPALPDQSRSDATAGAVAV